MTLRRSVPLHFSPTTACDAVDSTDISAGAMQKLSNLIADPTTKNLFQCRPASILKTDFSIGGFSSPGFISCMKVIGTIVYGMIATARNPGRDEPFAYDLNAGLFLPITGTIDATTTPTSSASSGTWTPPQMDLIGVRLVVANSGFAGSGSFIGWFDITNPSAPTWNAGNLGGAITFTTPPIAVKNFNGRAYYLINPATGQPSAVYSDVLNAVNATNANQVLTFDDNVPLTALGALPLQNQLGGIIQALIVFKGVTNIYQVTGDAASSNLAKNALNITTGTLAANSVCSTPKGLAFASPEGIRIIDFNATVSDPIGNAGTGITVPFTYSVVPTRMSGACGGNILRMSTQNGAAPGSPQQEWWYDFARSIWTGPHTFPASLMQPFNNSFIITPISVTRTLFQSDVVQSASSAFVENGVQMTFDWITSPLPDTDQMCENNIVEQTIYMALLAGNVVNCYALQPDGTQLADAVQISLAGQQTIWGQFNWGQSVWQGVSSQLFPRQIMWTKPVVFRRAAFRVTGNSFSTFKIGRMHMKYEMLGYLQGAA